MYTLPNVKWQGFIIGPTALHLSLFIMSHHPLVLYVTSRCQFCIREGVRGGYLTSETSYSYRFSFGASYHHVTVVTAQIIILVYADY